MQYLFFAIITEWVVYPLLSDDVSQSRLFQTAHDKSTRSNIVLIKIESMLYLSLGGQEHGMYYVLPESIRSTNMISDKFC